jgi:hypothetical protein
MRDEWKMPDNIIYWAVVVTFRNGKSEEWCIAKDKYAAIEQVKTIMSEDILKFRVDEVRVAGVYNDPENGPTRWFTENIWVVGLVKL